MSEDQLYELARRRIDRRNRRWILWGADFLAFMMFIGAMVTIHGFPDNVGRFVSLAWIGVLCLHGVIINLTQNRDQEIDAEVARLRREVYDEKPKRLELSDDGELTDIGDLEERPDKRRRDSV